METLKLQVGKTYRSREGEEVKITDYDRGYYQPYKGTNGEWYTEGGRWRFFSSEESPKDLIEEVPETSHTFNLVPGALTATRYFFDIPDGVKKIAVSQEGNRIIVEMMSDTEVENKCFPYIPENMKKVITAREINKVLARIKKVYQLEDIDMDSRKCKQVEAKAILAYYLIGVKKICHVDAAKILGRKRSIMYHYMKLVEDLYQTNIPFRERFNKTGIPWKN